MAGIARAGRGATAATLLLMLAAALVEMVTLALLALLLALLTQGEGDRLRRLVGQGFAAVDLHDPALRIAALMLVIVGAITLHSLLLAGRNLQLIGLQRRFLDHLRSDLIAHVASTGMVGVPRPASCPHRAGAQRRHPRVALCLQLLLAVTLAIIMLGTQWLIVLALTPMLAGLVVLVGSAGPILTLPVIRRAKDMGWVAKRSQVQPGAVAGHDRTIAGRAETGFGA